MATNYVENEVTKRIKRSPDSTSDLMREVRKAALSESITSKKEILELMRLFEREVMELIDQLEGNVIGLVLIKEIIQKAEEGILKIKSWASTEFCEK
jgi:hypothetical protein